MAKGPTKPMYKRIMFVAGALLLCGFIGLLVRLCKLQIIDYKIYQRKAIEQQTRDISIAPKRGTIYDRTGKALAVSASAYMVFVAPSSIKDDVQKTLVIDGLAGLLQIDKSKIEKACNKSSFYELVARRIEKPLADSVREFIKTNNLYQAVGIAEDPKRYYPFGNFASHILGFTGVDGQGLSGLEESYDTYLKGVPGRIVTARNAQGNEMPFDYETLIESQDGQSLTLTIDEVIQHFMEKHLDTARIENKVQNRAAGIAMDVKTGEILAMSVKPDYDLNSPFTISDPTILEALKAYQGDELKTKTSEALNTMWRNKIITEQYEPGSIFKIMTASMAVEEDLVNDKETFVCNGFRVVAGQRIRCAKAGGHGVETFLQGLENSCNPVFMDIGARIGGTSFFKYVTAFGFRSKTGIDLPGEGLGIFHQESKIGPVELATSSFGQTFKVTPMQLITAISGVLNDGKLMQPHLVKDIKDAKGNITTSFAPKTVRQVISKETSDKLCLMLEGVVNEGTGRNCKIPGYRVGGKTATSEKIDEKNTEGIADKRIVAFMAFAPADDPKIAVLMLLDEPDMPVVSGGMLVAPYVKAFLQDVLPYLGYEPQLTAEEITKNEVVVPNFVTQGSADAIKSINNLKLKNKLIGGEGTVKYQIPSAGQRIPAGGVVMLYTNSESPPASITVPNIAGMSPSAANAAIINAGFNVKFTTATDVANLVVGSCSPAIGTSVPPGTIINIELRLVNNND